MLKNSHQGYCKPSWVSICELEKDASFLRQKGLLPALVSGMKAQE